MSEIRNALRSGYDAYYAAYSTGFFGAAHRPQRTTNPYSTNPSKDLWLRGWREAEKAFSFKGQYLQPNPFVLVPGLRDAVQYYEAKARSKAQKRPTAMNPAFAAPYGQDSRTGRFQSNKPNKSSTPKTQWKPVDLVYSAPAGGVRLDKLNRFNKKYRTVA